MNKLMDNRITGRTDDIITNNDSLMRGIYLWMSGSNEVVANTIDTIGWHITAQQMSAPTYMTCNDMRRGIGGTVVFNNGQFGPIGTTSVSWYNEWLGTFSKKMCLGTGIIGSALQDLFYASSPSSQDPSSSFTSPWSPISASTTITTCPTGSSTTGSGATLAERIQMYQDAWTMADTTDSLPGLSRWLFLYGLYEGITTDDSLQTDSTLNAVWGILDTLSTISYYDEFGNPILAPVHLSDFAELERALMENDTSTVTSRLGTLESTLLTDPSAYDAELKLYEACKLQYQTVFLGADTLTANQFDSLYTLACLCPDDYGLAPFRAQAILATYGVLDEYNGCGSYKWGGPGEGESPVNKQELEFRLYPNPTTGKLTIEWPSNGQTAEIIIMDLVGHILVQEHISGDSHVLDLGTWTAGVYIYKITSNTMGVKTGQIIIVKEE